MSVVGRGVYRAIQWEIIRGDDDLCSIMVQSIFSLNEENKDEYTALTQTTNTSDNKYTTARIYRRKQGREVARVLATTLWSIYDRYSYGIT